MIYYNNWVLSGFLIMVKSKEEISFMGRSILPTFSIIVPVYNVGSLIGKCVESIIEQTFLNWELFLIDDGSTDDSGTICDSFAQKDERIKVFHTSNLGVSAARNLGLSHSSGLWLSFVDSDDYVDRDWLMTIKSRIDSLKAELYTWGNYYETENGIEWQTPFVPEDRVYNTSTEFIETNNYRHACYLYMYQADWIRKYHCLFPIGVKRSEDQCFLLQYLSHNPMIHSVTRPFYHYVRREGSVCNSSYTIDDAKDNLVAANKFAQYALGFDAIDKRFVLGATTRLYRDYFHYVKIINRLHDSQTQSKYTQSYKEIVRLLPDFKKDVFLRRAKVSIGFSYRAEAVNRRVSKVSKLFKTRIKQIIHPFKVVEDMIKWEQQILLTKIEIEQRENRKNATTTSAFTDMLKWSALYSEELGVSNVPLCDHEVVVSLTTYRQRLHEVYLTIESIMQGTMKPNRIILWLADDEFGGRELPIVLQRQMMRGLEVRYCEDLLSYKKIIPTLIICPDSCIVTIDDDAIYEPDLLEHLIASYKEHPDCVSASRTHFIRTDSKGMPLPYMSWNRFQYDYKPSHLNFLTGVGGSLFPPKSLHRRVLDKELFMNLCSRGDDIWLNAMLMLNGVKVVKAFTHSIQGDDFVKNESPYVNSLWSSNQCDCGNDSQIRAVWNYFKLYELVRES